MATEKLKVKFTETVVVDDHRKGTKAEEKYVAGKVYGLSEASAMHWINRGKAELAGNSARASN